MNTNSGTLTKEACYLLPEIDAALPASPENTNLIIRLSALFDELEKLELLSRKENKPKFKETVNHPKHYNSNSDSNYETIKVLKAWLSPEQYEGFLISNSLKYQSRYKHKNGLEDLKKSQWYQNELIKEYESGYLN